LPPEKGASGTDVVVYYKFEFEQGVEPFVPVDKTRLETVEGGVSGKALSLRKDSPDGDCGATLPLKLSGSKDLKLAYHCKASGFPQAGINVSDTVSRDNTTPTGYRCLSKDAWTPILYYLDSFHYNSQPPDWTSKIKQDAIYNGLALHGQTPGFNEPWMLIDNFVIYRGNDRTPPSQVKGLKAQLKDGGVHLSWEPATDNVAVMLYVISRADGPQATFTKIAESIGPSYIDSPP